MVQLHSLLKRQLRKHLRSESIPEELDGFINAVNKAYQQADSDRGMLEHSLEISSKELLQASAELKAILHAFPDLFITIDFNGKILDSRGGGGGGFNITPEKLIGRKIQETPLKIISEGFYEATESIRATSSICCLDYSLKNGNDKLYYEARILALSENHFIMIVRNVTESKIEAERLENEIIRRKSSEKALQIYQQELEDKINSRTKELKKSYQQLAHAGRLTSLGEMATGIAHEINQPLTIISLATQVLKGHFSKDDEASSVEVKSLHCIEEQINRASNIITNMRAFSRSNTDSASPIDISEPLAVALSFFQEQFRLHEITLTCSIAESLPKVKIDSQKFEQIVINFLSNARYAVEERAEDENENYMKTIYIRILADSSCNEVIFEIEDNGTGMTPEKRDRCLEPFFTTKEVGQGTGLGLSIARNIVNEFKGRLEVESTEGKGSLFRIFFPARNQDSKINLPLNSVPPRSLTLTCGV